MTDRAFLKREIKRLKDNVKRETDHFLGSTNVSTGEVELITGWLWRLHECQCRLNATYKPMDERVILERVAKRRGKK